MWDGRTALAHFLSAAVGNPGDLRRESFHMILLLVKEAFRNKDGHGDVFVAQLLKAPVQYALYVFPDRVCVRPENIKALDTRVVDQRRLRHDIREPLGKIGVHFGDLLTLLFLCHWPKPFKE
jgi:hypothetical protein